ncbi:uncharacterized protein LOC121795536 isoform X3 [Salvia splendens]|nr:uncharacterized protein LOC121795536 isoform X3 [Salvia splendens]XP_042050014.1 uncharacterized protein LOC121795536 isoform X3 [Salvia splendens]
MAGFNVCLFEKGRKWEAKDFPLDSFKIFSAVRLENKSMGINIGRKDALFQVHVQDDSLAATACGLGGGSLVNAGVILPTPVRARRDPRWPEPWEKDWDRYEALVSDMLNVQSVPTVFQNSNIMQQVADNEYDKSIHEQLKLSINFSVEDSRKFQQPVNCLACGNCLAGCPYNAKNSTDKTYLVSAIKAGCTIKTESEVQYVVRNDDYIYSEKGGFKARSKRRWLVFLNEFDYVASDIVILSAGVFGTAKILFQSRLRGLSTSEKLGSGLSCNGSNVAYLAGSSAPLNAYGLNETQFSGLPFQERPGPSISSSYTSSLGFTIQSAVIPAAYPRSLFKGITTYKWQSSNCFLHVVIDVLKRAVGLKRGQDMVLNVMGYDDSSGQLTFDKDANRIEFCPPRDTLLPRKIEAFQKLAKKLGGTLFMSRYRSTSVHLLGGCIAASDASSGVCNPHGQVFDGSSLKEVHAGLYVCDASIIPCSVGINPCLTIAAAAEHVSRKLVQNGAKKYIRDFGERELNSKIKMETSRDDSEVVAKETMRGQVGGMPCTAYLKLRFKRARAGKCRSLLQGEVGGHIICKSVEMEKMHIIHGEVELCKTNSRAPYTQYMHYHLLLAASSGSRYVLEGRKVMSPYLLALYAWRESTTLNVKLSDQTGDKMTNLKGKLHISALELLKCMCTLEGRSRIKFLCLLTRSLIRTYILQVPRTSHESVNASDSTQRHCPSSKIHEIKTEDDFIISCQHWRSHQSRRSTKHYYPLLLLNGYSTESFSLPTEPNDLVRTFLQEGHDVLLLRTRLHPLNASNDFSIEDIGKIDIPAAMLKIVELYGESIKVHVVAHCVGGLAIHISIMGGHVSAKHIASLSCTNSSMFFKLTTSASIKMWLPLIPISMRIMGKNKTLHLIQTSTTSIRHRLLKSIAHLIPRQERCTCDECEVFSGIFGNTFWHENVSHVTHQWMNKENQTKLPMAGFSHLRKICNAGFIVDSSGNNTYLIHPERMALPTLYISGERVILVTPETSFLANKYMKLHQSGYRHERVVVDGFGHSDLLIGEESHEKVFPHIQRHIELAEDEQDSLRNYEEAVAWSDDPYKDGAGFGSCIIILMLVLLFIAGFYW